MQLASHASISVQQAFFSHRTHTSSSALDAQLAGMLA
jgi:hypothetical protein